MGFIMDGLDAEAYDRSYSDKDLVRRIAGYFRPETGRMVAVATMVTLQSVANLAIPIYISYSLDQIQQNPSFDRLLVFTVVLILLASAAWGFNAIRPPSGRK